VSGALERLRGGLVVSCQAPPGSPLRAGDCMVAMARAAEAGGADGIRTEGADVAAVKEAVGVPVIGLRKRPAAGSPVIITPELEDALAVAADGADVLAVDATLRPRPGALDVGSLLRRLAGEAGIPVLADVDTLDAGIAARECGAAAVATTLSGYTVGEAPEGPDLGLVELLVTELDCPVVAEGRYSSPEQVAAAFELGAFAVVVGTAITDPLALTRRFAAAAPRSTERVVDA
jgi:putative N-acetylmannosamine-6-phosphate epimerase